MSLLSDKQLRQGGRYVYEYFDMDGTSSTVFPDFHGTGSRQFYSPDDRLGNLNQAANSGYVVKKVLNNYDRHLAKFGSAPGVVLDESKAGGKIERLSPAPMSEGHITAAALSADDMKEISGVNFDLLGQLIEGHNESGKAIELRQAQGMKVVEIVFDSRCRLGFVGT